MSDTSFSDCRHVLENPFVNMKDPQEAANRMSLEPPSIREMIGRFTMCIRRSGHSALVGFQDPTLVSCAEDASMRFNAYRYWGYGAIPAAAVAAAADSSSPATSSTTTTTAGKSNIAQSSASSSSSAAIPSLDDQNNNIHNKGVGSAGVSLVPKGEAIAVLERKQHALISEKRFNKNPYAKNGNNYILHKDNANYDDAVRFVLYERRATVDLAKLPWAPRERYIEVLRGQGRLPEQVEEAMTAIKRQVQQK